MTEPSGRDSLNEERGQPPSGSPPRGDQRTPQSPMWAWVLPLVIVVIVLMWYILTRGEPRSLFGGDSGTAPSPAAEVDSPPAPVPTAPEPASTAQTDGRAQAEAEATDGPIEPEDDSQPESP